MTAIGPALRVLALALTGVALAGCGANLGSIGLTGSATAPSTAPPGAPRINLAGRWLLSSPGQGQCNMTLGAASPAAIEGTIAPEGGCPGKFFTSRKWTYEQGSLVMRDHNGRVLAQLSETGDHFEGKAASGLPLALMR